MDAINACNPFVWFLLMALVGLLLFLIFGEDDRDGDSNGDDHDPK